MFRFSLLALVGGAASFLVAGDLAFVEGAFIGTVLLVGLVANDSIVLIDRYRTLRAARSHGRVMYSPD